jgi:hypothetical protein
MSERTQRPATRALIRRYAELAKWLIKNKGGLLSRDKARWGMFNAGLSGEKTNEYWNRMEDVGLIEVDRGYWHLGKNYKKIYMEFVAEAGEEPVEPLEPEEKKEK